MDISSTMMTAPTITQPHLQALRRQSRTDVHHTNYRSTESQPSKTASRKHRDCKYIEGCKINTTSIQKV
jgi:hypothetical protein